MEIIPHPGHPIGHDQSMAQGSRFAFCQRSVGKHPLPGYGSVAHGKRLVRTRMLGVVGGWGRKTPGYPIKLCNFRCHSKFL